MFDNPRSHDKRQEDSEEPSGDELENRPDEQPQDREQDVPVTGNDYTVGNQVDEIEMSDLIDLSDSEDMDERADHIDPLAVAGFEDTSLTEMAKYTSDPDILEDLGGRDALPTGTQDLLSELKEHTSESPDLSGDDLDASWWSDRESGEESVGGSVATPEQNVVDELGEATGVRYNDFEPLDTEDKLDDRDRNRWELNAASADDDETQVAYDENKYRDESREDSDDYGKVERDFSRLMNDEEDEDIGADVDEFGDDLEEDDAGE